MAKSATRRNWDLNETIELIRLIFEHKESIFDKKEKVNAWTGIVKQLNDKNIDRNMKQVKGKWKLIQTDFHSKRLSGNLRIK